MGQLVIGLVIGVALGAAACALVLSRRHAAVPGELLSARAALAAAETRALDLQASIERERENHAQALSNLSDRFKVLAQETLDVVVRQFHDGQVQAIEQREQKLDERLDPLQTLLREYKAKVEDLDTKRATGMANVENAAKALLDAQRAVMDETQKLNTILGRASARGRWGEVQLQRILEMSGMSNHIDFDTQRTLTGSNDSRQRPDVVINLPNGAQIAIDSKVPFDAFDRAMALDNDADKEVALREYATAMRQHVTELKRREYWSSLKVAPAFVVCFVPSDALLSAAFSADPALFEDAQKSKVLLAGPTSLLGLLWSTWLGWSQFETSQNVAEITELAKLLVDRTSDVFKHASKLGRSLDASTKDYNSLVGSMEERLFVTVRKMQLKGVPNQKVIETIESLPRLASAPNKDRWLGNDDDDIFAIEAQIVTSPSRDDDGDREGSLE